MNTYVAVRSIGAEDAGRIAVALAAIAKEKGRLTTKEQGSELVRRSQNKASATHHLFEWDDHKAAQLQRLDRAIELIAAVWVVFEEQPEQPVRAFPVVTVDGKKGPYPIRKVLASRDLTAAMLEEAKQEMMRFRQRYEGLKALALVFAAIDKALAKENAENLRRVNQ